MPRLTPLRALHTTLAVAVPASVALMYGLSCAAVAGRRRGLNAMSRLLGRLGAAAAGMRIHVEGRERLADARPAVVIFNHRSGVDPILLCRIMGRDVVGVVKARWRRHPAIGPLLKFGDTLFIDPQAPPERNDFLQQGRARLEQGLSVIIAPEGTRRAAEAVGPFKTGAFELAQSSGRPLVAVVIRGADRVLPPRSLAMRPGRVTVQVKEVIPAADWTTLSPREAADRMQARYRQWLAEPSSS